MTIGSQRAPIRRDDVVLIPFPFTDLSGTKRRPALVIGPPRGDDVVLAFVSSSVDDVDRGTEHVLSPSDPEFAGTGLKLRSRIRLGKIATLHRGLATRRLGRIGPRTRRAVEAKLRVVLDL